MTAAYAPGLAGERSAQRFGLFDLRTQVEVLSARRSETPKHYWGWLCPSRGPMAHMVPRFGRTGAAHPRPVSCYGTRRRRAGAADALTGLFPSAADAAPAARHPPPPPPGRPLPRRAARPAP